MNRVEWLLTINLLQNFLTCIMDAQYKHIMVSESGDRNSLGVSLDNLNIFFTIIFAFELLLNIFANWFHRFARNGWSILDTIIVILSMLDFGSLDLPDWLARLLRAFRIVRLFGRVKELRKMFSAISSSIFPMMNAFVILVIVLSVCEYIKTKFAS